jgi:hypothetical protein
LLAPIGDAELAAKLEDELKHEKDSGLEDLDSSVQNIQYVLQNNSWEVCADRDKPFCDPWKLIISRSRMFPVSRRLS